MAGNKGGKENTAELERNVELAQREIIARVGVTPLTKEVEGSRTKGETMKTMEKTLTSTRTTAGGGKFSCVITLSRTGKRIKRIVSIRGGFCSIFGKKKSAMNCGVLLWQRLMLPTGGRGRL